MTIKSKGFAKFDHAFMMMLQQMIDDNDQKYKYRLSMLESDFRMILGFTEGLLYSNVLTINEYKNIWDAITNMYMRMKYDENI